MKSKVKKLSALFLVSISMGSLLSGCAVGSDKAYPITVGGVEVVVGETEVGALIDAGYSFTTLVDGTSVEVYATDMLDANSYYTSIFLRQEDNKSVMMAVTTDAKSVPFSSAIIAEMSFYNNSDLSEVTFDGVALSELTGDIIKEHVSGVKESDGNTGYYLSTSNYYINFDMEDDKIVEFDIKRKYDVDYSN